MYRSIMVLGVFGPLCLPALAHCQAPDERLVKLCEQWQQRRAAIRTLEIKLKGRGVIPKGRYAAGAHSELPAEMRKVSLPAEDHVFEKRLEWSFDFDRNWMRRLHTDETMYGGTGKLFPFQRTWLFDGKEIKVVSPRDLNTTASYTPAPLDSDLLIAPGDRKKFDNSEVFDWPALFAAGVIPTEANPVHPARLRGPLGPTDFIVQDTAVWEGFACLVVRTTGPIADRGGGYFEYWVDPSRGGAIVRANGVTGGRQYCFTNVRYAETPDGWMPTGWNAGMIWAGKSDVQADYDVVELKVNGALDPRDFEVALKPGMIVQIDIADDYKKFVVDSDGATLLEIVGDQLPALTKRRGLWWWALATALLGLSGVAAWRYQRHRSRHTLV